MRNLKKFMPLYLLFLSAAIWSFESTSQDDTTSNLPTIVGSSPETYRYLDVTEYISLDTYSGSIPGVELSCEQSRNGKIGFCGGECTDQVGDNKGAQISRTCADFVDRIIPHCVALIGCQANVAFCGVGGHAKRTINSPDGPSDTPSRHSSGDAMDLFGIRCKDGDGNDINLDFNSEGFRQQEARRAQSGNQTQNRYTEFVRCWREKVEA